MASSIVDTRPIGAYTLPETDRRQILSEAPSYLMRLEIERQRLAFAKTNGSEFGEIMNPRELAFD